MIYGYARCSTNEERQDIDRQKRELYTLGVTDNKYIYWEYESGTNDDRAELQKLMDTVSEGDTIATTEVSRLTRSTKHLCEILQTVKEKKLILDIGGSFRVDCSKGEMDPMTEGMVKMWGVFAEMERNMIVERTQEGKAIAKQNNPNFKEGRPKTDDQLIKLVVELSKNNHSIKEIVEITKLSRSTVMRIRKEYLAE